MRRGGTRLPSARSSLQVWLRAWLPQLLMGGQALAPRLHRLCPSHTRPSIPTPSSPRLMDPPRATPPTPGTAMGAWASTEHKSRQPCDNCEAEQSRGTHQEGPASAPRLGATVLTEGVHGPPRGSEGEGGGAISGRKAHLRRDLAPAQGHPRLSPSPVPSWVASAWAWNSAQVGTQNLGTALPPARSPLGPALPVNPGLEGPADGGAQRPRPP